MKLDMPPDDLGIPAPDRFRPFIDRHGLTRVGSGCSRATYRTRSGRYVVKFPWCDDCGETDNRYEHKGFSAGVPYYARCRLIRVAGADCLVMEWVDPLKCFDPPDELPDWVDGIDCSQVGHTRRGKLVAYDYA